MHHLGRTLVRLSPDNRLRVDRFRRHHDYSRDRLVNEIVREFFDRDHIPVAEPRLRKRRAA